MCRLINLSGLFQPLTDLVRPPDAEFEVLTRFSSNHLFTLHSHICCRENCTVEIAGHHIIKVYTGLDKKERTRHIQAVYDTLNNKGVPHIDSLVHTFDTTVILSPRGIAKPPTSEKELLDAVIFVLEALEARK